MGRRTLEAVTASVPQFPRAWANLGYTDFAGGNLDHAEGSLRKALFLDAGFCPARTLLARIERNYGNEDAAASLEMRCETTGIHVRSRHASRVGRLYKVQRAVVLDDVLPPGLLAYCEPISFIH
jgi:hypothetical protein